MDVERSSGKLFPNWEEARAYYTTHYHKACMHIIPPSFPPNSPKKKKSKTDKTDKSAAPSTRCRRRRNSSDTSAGNYCPLYDSDDPVTPAVVNPPGVATPHLPPAAAGLVARSPGTAGNPIEVPSNLPTPITKQTVPKARKKAQGFRLGVPAPLSPTPPSEAFPTILKTIANSRKTPGPSTSQGPDRFVYVCDCSDGEDGYSALSPSLKRKAASLTNNASGSGTRPNEVIEIQTDSDTDIVIRPFPQPRFCKCAALRSFLDSPAVGDVNPNTSVDMDAIPEIPRTSPARF